jgi:hypothetical protein
MNNDASPQRVTWPIAFRLVVAAWFTVSAIRAVVSMHDKPYWPGFVGTGIVLFVVPSLAIAWGISLRRAWAYWSAIASDATFFAYGLGSAIGSTYHGLTQGVPHQDWLYPAWIAVSGAVALFEGGYLLRKLNLRWQALWIYVPTVICIVSVTGWLGAIDLLD